MTARPPIHGLTIAFLHLAPQPGEIALNRQRLVQAVETAAANGAGWILTPECAVTGFTFADTAGTDWILPQPDPWMTRLCETTARLNVTLFLSHPERDSRSGKLHNTVFVIDRGVVTGHHRKINALKVGSEAWSSAGHGAAPVDVPPVGPVGLLVCADAYTPGIVKTLAARGARLLVSPASWAPGLHGPETVWESCTSFTGLPLLVCNRTGMDRFMDFTKAESVIARDGRRLFSFHSAHPSLILVPWNVEAGQPAAPPQTLQLDSAH